MKIFTPILTLFAASMAIGSTLDNCKNELKEYSGCIFDYTKISSSKLNQYCTTYYSSKCQKYVDNPKEYVPSCYNLDSSYRIDDLILLKYKKALLNLICQNDNDGNRCTISEIFFGKNVSSSSYVKDVVDATCKHSKCRNMYVEYLEAKYELGENGEAEKYDISNIDLNSISEMKKYIQSEECVGKGSSKASNDASNTGNKVPISTVPGRCGPDFGACSKEGQCCSKYGYCGTSEAYCGNNCQSEYGNCSSNISPKENTTTKKTTTTTTTTKKTTTTITKKPTSTVSGRCGSSFGGGCPKADQCCSKYGYCGTSTDHCGTGCQSEFGKCNNNGDNNTTTKKTTSTTTTKKVTTTKKTSTTTKKTTTTTTTKKATATVNGRCGTKYGGACAKAGLCCSKYGYCGTSSSHCGSGCQSQFGVCK